MKDKIIKILMSETFNTSDEAGNSYQVIEEKDFDDVAERIIKLFDIPVAIERFCEGQQVEWNELKYWVVEDKGEDKVLVANSKTQQHHEYNDWWVNRDELNAL